MAQRNWLAQFACWPSPQGWLLATSSGDCWWCARGV